MSNGFTGEPRNVLGPLTTTFTPPPACTFAVAGPCGSSPCSVAFWGQSCDASTGAVDAATCWPATASGAVSLAAPFHGWGFYSPGTLCPSGYASACSATAGAGGGAGWEMEFPLEADETAVGCCPT